MKKRRIHCLLPMFVPNGSKISQRIAGENSITADGMHLCMNIVGQRINAGLACIMQCAYDNEQQHHHQESTSEGKNDDNGWACATSCNDRFMSLEHVVV